MAQLAAKHVERLEDIKEKIRESHNYFKDNIERYHAFKRAVYKTSVTDTERDQLAKLNRPFIEVNGLEAYENRLRGLMAEQIPSPQVQSTDPLSDQTALCQFIEDHLRLIQDEANKENFNNEIWKDTLGGGFSVATIWTDYENERSFNQTIKIGRVFDPTLCGFDPMARTVTKMDGKYCFELFPMYKEEAEDLFKIDLDGQSFLQGIDGFNWFYQESTKKIVLVAHFYEKQYKDDTLYYLADSLVSQKPTVMTKKEYDAMIEKWDDITEPPKVINKRKTRLQTICRYTVLGNKIIDYTETDFTMLPYVFIDGNSVMLRDSEGSAAYQMTRPYVYHAIGMQRIKNVLAQTFLNEVQNLSQSKYLMPEGAFPKRKEYQDAWLRPQKPSTLLYNDFDDTRQQPIAPPIVVDRQQIPPEIFSAFAFSDEAIRNILSSFDPNVALNSNDISGKAVIEGITQSNATAMPYMFNYLSGLTQIFRIIVDIIPKYYITPRSIPVIDSDGRRAYNMINVPNGVQIANKYGVPLYDASSLSVGIETGVNFDIEKQKSVDIITQLSQAYPSFGQFINQSGIGFLLKQVDMNGIDELRDLYSQTQEQMQQQQASAQQQPNPAMMDLQIKAQKQQADAQKQAIGVQIDQQRLALDQQQLALDAHKLQLQAQLDARDQNIQEFKAQTEQISHMAQLKMKEMEHNLKTQSNYQNNVQNVPV